MKTKIVVLSIILFFGIGYGVLAQNIKSRIWTTYPKSWQNLDLQNDKLYGISIEKAYNELLKNKASTQVLVAVIDGGIDTLHVDLKKVIWHNPREKANGKDNDHNGYIGDIYGWNFMGNAKDINKNVVKDTYEVNRFYLAYKSKFENIKTEEQLRRKDRVLYREWLKSKSLSGRGKEAFAVYLEKKKFELYETLNPFLKKMLNKEVYTFEDLKQFKTDDKEAIANIQEYVTIFSNYKSNITNVEIPKKINYTIDSLAPFVKYVDTVANIRNTIVGDKYNDINDRYYGNNNVMAGDPSHGTHVAGIIGAVRNNGLGINGIADNVKIMPLRVTPSDGDEHDKDVALAIRYAVDNGAKIINMSFGKAFSIDQKWVEKAIRYANRKGVLLVHAAGNDSKNIDVEDNFPTSCYMKKNKKAPNIITVGASGPDWGGEGVVASFSNYGKEMVDVFAPGVRINSTLPDNKYGAWDGTSMATPIVTGIAAVLKSYFPHLSAKQIKKIIEDSVTKITVPVNIPGTEKKVSMTSLCRTGGIVNAYNAIKLAENIK